MKIKRTRNEHYYNRPTWPKLNDGGKVDYLDEDGMARVIRNHGSLSGARHAPFDTFENCWNHFIGCGKLESFGAIYELIEP